MRSDERALRPVTLLMAYAQPTLGMERVALALASLLATSQHVRVVVISGPAPDLIGVESVSLGSHPKRLAMLSRWWRVLRARRTLAGDPLILVGAWVAIPALAVPGLTSSTTVVWEHSLMREQLATTFARRVLWRCARVLYRRVARIVAVSGPLGDDLAAVFGRAQVSVIPNPVTSRDSDEDRALPSRYNRAGGRTKMVSVGSLTANKRHHLAIDAVAKVPNATLDIYGDGPEREALEGQIRRLGVGDRVRLRGYTPHEEVMRVLTQSDLLVHPSAGETFGMVFVEAADAALPVAAASNRVADWMIPAYVPGRTFATEDELGEIMRTGIESSGSEQAAARAARDSDFAADAVARRWEALFVELRGGQ